MNVFTVFPIFLLNKHGRADIMGTVNEQECFFLFLSLRVLLKQLLRVDYAIMIENKEFWMKDRLHFNQVYTYICI
jgi:hypothetical protein